MKRILLVSVFAAVGAFAVQMNDLAPDFDNTISDDGFWDTTEHVGVEVASASSDVAEFDALDARVSTCCSGAIALFDSRETTQDESSGLARFTSCPKGITIDFR